MPVIDYTGRHHALCIRHTDVSLHVLDHEVRSIASAFDFASTSLICRRRANCCGIVSLHQTENGSTYNSKSSKLQPSLKVTRAHTATATNKSLCG